MTRSPTAIEIHIPVLPPSTNAMNGHGKGRVYNTKAYKRWRRDTAWDIKSQRPAGIVGPYRLTIQAVRTNNRADIDNIIKPISDALQDSGVIANDCYCEMVSARWVTIGEGVTVRVEKAGVG